jgi:hypothetical protein
MNVKNQNNQILRRVGARKKSILIEEINRRCKKLIEG